MKYIIAAFYLLCGVLNCYSTAHSDTNIEKKYANCCKYENCLGTYLNQLELFVSCNLGSNEKQSFKILRQGKDFYTYYKKFGSSSPILLKGKNILPCEATNDDLFLSSLEYIDAACVGKEEKIFTAFYPPAAGKNLFNYFVRYNSKTKEWQEIEIDAANYPVKIYINEKDFMVLVENDPADREDKDNIYNLIDYRSKTTKQVRTPPHGSNFTVLTPKMTYESYKPGQASRW